MTLLTGGELGEPDCGPARVSVAGGPSTEMQDGGANTMNDPCLISTLDCEPEHRRSGDQDDHLSQVGSVPEETLDPQDWEEFRALLEWSVRRKDADDAPPPTDFIVTSSQYEGELSADGAQFVMKLQLDVLRKKGWKRIPVLPGNVAITEAKLPDGVFLHSAGKRYDLLTEASGEISATLSFSVAVRTAAGINQVGFPRHACS